MTMLLKPGIRLGLIVIATCVLAACTTTQARPGPSSRFSPPCPCCAPMAQMDHCPCCQGHCPMMYGMQQCGMGCCQAAPGQPSMCMPRR